MSNCRAQTGQWWRVFVLVGWLIGLVPTATQAASDSDPLEGLNRAIFTLNDGLDAIALRPLAATYDKLTPAPARTGISNFLSNFYDVNAALNALLQGRLKYAFTSSGRVVVNSTLGFFGFFDVATDMGIERYQTDFGHTMSTWGVPQGPYVMLPILGPRTMRAAVGSGVDGWVSPVWQNLDDNTAWGLRGLDVINLRASLLDTDTLITGDRYVFVRDVYLQQRAVLVGDGEVADSFSEFDSEWEEDDL